MVIVHILPVDSCRVSWRVREVPFPTPRVMLCKVTTREDWDAHNFSVERAEGGFRGVCTCGWTGPSIAADSSTGAEDVQDRERVYDEWDRHHVPGYRDRNPFDE